MKNLRCTVRPGQRNHITVATGTAGGLVKLHQPNTPEEAKQLYSDSNRILHLYVHPPAEDASSLKVSLHTEDGHISLEMRSALQATEEYPYQSPANPATKGCETRPALTDEEARTLTNEELVRRGYSPRPILPSDQICSYWLRAVKQSMTRLEPITIPRRTTRRKHPRTMTPRTAAVLAITESPNWCDIETRATATGYQFMGYGPCPRCL